MMRLMLAALITALLGAGPAMGQGSVCAHGGGANWDHESHREMVRWMIAQARAGMPGDHQPVRVAVLGAVPREENDPDAAADAFRREGAEATALVILENNADDPAIAAAIGGARIVWIRGGNQLRYVNWWQGTATERAIRAVFESGGVVGGTSAGCAILGEVSYDARNGSLRPEQALADSHHENLTLTAGFLNVVPGVLFDSHFTERGRIGRLPVMMARAQSDLGKDVLGVGVDHGTALMIDPDGNARVIGKGSVGFIHPPQPEAVRLTAGSPPLIADVRYSRLAAGGVYSLPRRSTLSLHGNLPALAMRTGAEDSGRVVIADVWSRDGDLEERVAAAHDAATRTSPAAAILLGRGGTVAVDPHGVPWIAPVDREAESAPVSAVCIFHEIGPLTGPDDEGSTAYNRAASAGGRSFCGGVLSILPAGHAARVGLKLSAPSPAGAPAEPPATLTP